MRQPTLSESKLTNAINTIFNALVAGKRAKVYGAIGTDPTLKHLVQELDIAQTKLNAHLSQHGKTVDPIRYQRALKDLS